VADDAFCNFHVYRRTIDGQLHLDVSASGVGIGTALMRSGHELAGRRWARDIPQRDVRRARLCARAATRVRDARLGWGSDAPHAGNFQQSLSWNGWPTVNRVHLSNVSDRAVSASSANRLTVRSGWACGIRVSRSSKPQHARLRVLPAAHSNRLSSRWLHTIYASHRKSRRSPKWASFKRPLVDPARAPCLGFHKAQYLTELPLMTFEVNGRVSTQTPGLLPRWR
jgi:hypothetical protein